MLPKKDKEYSLRDSNISCIIFIIQQNMDRNHDRQARYNHSAKPILVFLK